VEKEFFDIQKLVRESGIPRRTIHFYVQQGILPPPQGAGLAAFYTEDHLLRLRLVPVMRQEGLRLDEIRERLAKMTPEEMRQVVEKSTNLKPEAAVPYPKPFQPGTIGVGGMRYVHYALPGGVVLMVPEESNTGDRRIHLLLQAARQILSGGQPIITHLDSGAGNTPEQEE
jgi:DNA-binding transcriptional MerR regulator